MINFSCIPNSSLLGRGLRLPLRLVPKDAKVRILQGPLRGYHWIVGSSNHGCWLGTYELSKVRRLAEIVKPGMTCFDIGAHVGYYTLLFSVLVGKAGRVVAFEPLPTNVEFLRRHVAINRHRNVEILNLALTDFNGVAPFAEHESRSMGHLAESGSLRVECASLDSQIEEGCIPAPDILKIDVEGAELPVLKGARRILETAKPIIFLATHGRDAHSSCCRLLRDLGYRVESVDARPVDTSDELLAVAR